VAIDRASKAIKAGSEALRLTATPPFDWASIAAFLAARAIPGVEAVDGDRYWRAIAINGRRGTIDVAPDGADGIRVRLGGIPADAATEARLRRWFDLDADVAAISTHLARDPLLAPLVGARPGLRVPGAWDPFELAIRAIVGQQISVAGARTIAGRIVERCGDRLPGPPDARVVALFPTPVQLAAADLQAIGMPDARVRAIQGLAAAIAVDPDLLEATDDLDLDVARLRALPGIGEWTAQYIALRGLKHPDAFPASDLGLLRATAGADGRRPSPGELLAQAEAWRPYRAYAAQHLWTSAAG
jgi:AraC family transcriptional regulator of adaptative response / DNA-3-methyladenine glycosylase II